MTLKREVVRLFCFVERGERLSGYAKSHYYLAELKLKTELEKPERIKKEKEFKEQHEKDSDTELIEYVVKQKRRKGKGFGRYDLIGYCYLCERFGGWCKVMAQVNERIREIKKNNRRTIYP